jgi:hypothetical protein
MAFAKNIMLGGLSAGQADAIGGQIATVSATPAGTQASSLVVSSDYVYVTSTTGSCAVRLFAGGPGDSCVVINAGASVMFVWPPSGVAFLGTATNAAVTVPTSGNARYTCVNATTWVTEASSGGNTA